MTDKELKFICNLWLLVCNTIRIVAFVILSIYFNKWWLSLLSILFLTYNRENNYDR